MHNITKLTNDHYEIRITYTDALTGKRRSIRRRVTGTLTQAKQVRAELQHQIDTGAVETAKLNEITLDEWANRYLESIQSRLTASSVSSEAANIRAILPQIGEWLPNNIKRRHLFDLVQTFPNMKTQHGKLISKATLQHRVGTLKRLLKYTLQHTDGDLSLLLWIEVPKIEHRPKRTGRALSVDELRRFLHVVKEHCPRHYALFYILAATGQRWGSVSALRRQDIADGWITFAQSHVRGIVKDGNKTGTVVRLPLTDALQDVIDFHLAYMSANFPHATDLLFPSLVPPEQSATNGYLCSSDLRNTMRKMQKLAKVDPFRIHDLRHTFNSLQVEAGTDGTVLRSITAHSSTAMTDHYFHLSKEGKEKAIDKITNLLSSDCG